MLIALAADLLGRRELRRHDAARPSASRRRIGAAARAVEQLRDAEVEELHLAVGRDEDVRRLEVAVDDEVLVRVADGVAHHLEEREPASSERLRVVAVAVDRLAVDELHREVRQSVGA